MFNKNSLAKDGPDIAGMTKICSSTKQLTKSNAIHSMSIQIDKVDEDRIKDATKLFCLDAVTTKELAPSKSISMLLLNKNTMKEILNNSSNTYFKMRKSSLLGCWL
jgi:hypothetical protein